MYFPVEIREIDIYPVRFGILICVRDDRCINRVFKGVRISRVKQPVFLFREIYPQISFRLGRIGSLASGYNHDNNKKLYEISE
jgi:hypothetical protein